MKVKKKIEPSYLYIKPLRGLLLGGAFFNYNFKSAFLKVFMNKTNIANW